MAPGSEGSGMQSWLPRKCQRNQPESSWASRGHPPALFWPQSRQTLCIMSSGGFTTPHPTLSPGLFSTSLRLKCFHAFLSFFLHVSQMWVRSLYDGATGRKYAVALKSRGNSESTCVWHFKKLLKSDRMYVQICFGNYLFKLFKKMYVQTSISVFCLMHF